MKTYQLTEIDGSEHTVRADSHAAAYAQVYHELPESTSTVYDGSDYVAESRIVQADYPHTEVVKMYLS